MKKYQVSECISFRKTREEWGGLSNMCAGYPIEIQGIEIRTSEALYQSLKFPDHAFVQREILEQKSPMSAKMKAKKHRAYIHEDWEENKLEAMYYSLLCKAYANPYDKLLGMRSFLHLLKRTGDRRIVEISHKDRFWGAVRDKEDLSIAKGHNHLGGLLEVVRSGSSRPINLSGRFEFKLLNSRLHLPN